MRRPVNEYLFVTEEEVVFMLHEEAISQDVAVSELTVSCHPGTVLRSPAFDRSIGADELATRVGAKVVLCRDVECGTVEVQL